MIKEKVFKEKQIKTINKVQSEFHQFITIQLVLIDFCLSWL